MVPPRGLAFRIRRWRSEKTIGKKDLRLDRSGLSAGIGQRLSYRTDYRPLANELGGQWSSSKFSGTAGLDWSGLTKEMAGTSPRNWCAPPDRNLHERAVFYGRLSGKAIRVSFSIRSWSTPLSPRASLSRQPTLTIVRLVRLKDPANSEDVYGFALAPAGSHSRVHAHLWLARPH